MSVKEIRKSLERLVSITRLKSRNFEAFKTFYLLPGGCAKSSKEHARCVKPRRPAVAVVRTVVVARVKLDIGPRYVLS